MRCPVEGQFALSPLKGRSLSPVEEPLALRRRAGHTRYMSKQQWFRPEILGLPAYVPGKKGANTDVVKLSSNENPFPALPAVQAAVSAAVGDLNRYPDMFATGLVHDISCFTSGSTTASSWATGRPLSSRRSFRRS